MSDRIPNDVVELLRDLYTFVYGERIKHARVNSYGDCESCAELMARIDKCLAPQPRASAAAMQKMERP